MKFEKYSRAQVQVINSETIYQGFYSLNVLQMRHKLFAGEYSQIITREVIHNHAAVGVLLFDPILDQVLLVEQFRVGAFAAGDHSPWLLELVAGHVEAQESPCEVAKRESIEEANCHITHLESLGDYYSSPGSSTQKFSLFCGICDLTGAGGTYGLAEEDEDIRVHVLSSDEIFSMLENQQIDNAHTLIAVQWLRLHHQQLRQTYAS